MHHRYINSMNLDHQLYSGMQCNLQRKDTFGNSTIFLGNMYLSSEVVLEVHFITMEWDISNVVKFVVMYSCLSC